MTTPDDVRLALWAAHHNLQCFSLSDCRMEVYYPPFKHPFSKDDALKISALKVSAYFLGDGDFHFLRGEKEMQENSNTWKSPDPCAKAIEVINGWVKSFKNEK
jgi:hypothetical protein